MTKARPNLPKSTSNDSNALTKNSAWIPFLFFILAFLIYANTLQNRYAQDDDIYTRKNTFVQKGISSFPDLVNQGSLVGFDGTNVSDYRPLVLVNFALEKSLFGNNPKTHHFFNILFYGLICAVLILFLQQLFKNYPPYVPILIGLLFLLHPIHTEVVANIKSRDELLCFLFGLLALKYAYSHVMLQNTKHLIFASLAFFCSLLCKENGFVFLPLIALILYYFTSLKPLQIFKITLPFIVLALVNMLIRFAVLDSIFLNKSLIVMDNSLMAAQNYSEQLATNFTMLLHALWLLFFPLNLSYDYSFNQFPIVDWSNLEALVSLLLHLALLVLAVIGFRKKSIYSFAILFYFIAYSLTSNLVFKIGSSFAERFLFAPSLAFCIVLPFLLAKILKIDLKQISFSKASNLLAILALVFILFSIKTYSRNKVWKDNPTLFESGLESAPNSARVHFAYANEFREKVEASQDMYQKADAAKIALSSFSKGLSIYDKDERIYYNMGVIYYNLNQIDSAKAVYTKALQLKPDYPEALNNLGVIYFNAKDYPEALKYFTKSTESNPNYADAFANLGACYHNSGEVEKAIPFYEQALKLNPVNTNIMRNLSIAFNAIGDTAKANFYSSQASLY
jgi:tetratricopeptide (TPR) repeat protein